MNRSRHGVRVVDGFLTAIECGQIRDELDHALWSRPEASFGVVQTNLAWWQATKYPFGGKFEYHLDAG